MIGRAPDARIALTRPVLESLRVRVAVWGPVTPAGALSSSTTAPLGAAARRRDFALLLAGAAVSTVGGSLALLAVMVHLEPAGPGWIAAAWAGELVPVVLLAPWVGRIIDRFRNRELLLAAIALQALALALCALLGVREGGEVALPHGRRRPGPGLLRGQRRAPGGQPRGPRGGRDGGRVRGCPVEPARCRGGDGRRRGVMVWLGRSERVATR